MKKPWETTRDGLFRALARHAFPRPDSRRLGRALIDVVAGSRRSAAATTATPQPPVGALLAFSLSFSFSLSLSFSFSFSLSFHHSLTLVMQLATRSSRQEIARSGEIKCGRELSAAPSSARNQNFLCTHHSGLDLFFFLWDHVLNLGSNQGKLYEFKNSLIHFIVSSI